MKTIFSPLESADHIGRFIFTTSVQRVVQKVFSLKSLCLIMALLSGIVTLLPHKLQAQQVGKLSGTLTLPSTVATLTGTLGGVPIRVVSSDGTIVLSTATTLGGTFSLASITTGTYQVIPSISGGVFFPSITTITISTESIAQANFSFIPPLPVITGQILSAETGKPFPFAQVSIVSAQAQFNLFLDADSRFQIAVSTAGNYVVTPTSSTLRVGHIFTPTQVGASVDANGNVSNSPATFVAFVPQYRLRGVVRSLPSDPLTGNSLIRVQTLSASGSVIGLQITTAVVSAAGGEFMLSASSGTYSITTSFDSPFPSFYTITPSNRIVTINDANTNVEDVVITNRRYLIQGRIVSTTGTARVAMPSVPVRLEQFNTNLSITSATTDNQGNFTLRLEAARFTAISLRLIVTLPGYTLRHNSGVSNSEIVLNGLRDDTTLGEIIAVPPPPPEYPVTGRVLYPNRFPVQAPIVAIVTNANSSAVVTQEVPITLSADGRYSIAGVTSGIFRISLRSTNLVFTPSLIEVFMPRDAAAEFNFQATLAPILVSGRVQTLLDIPVPGVTLRVGGAANGVSTITDANGRYSMAVGGQYPDSRWLIFPSLEGTAFSPPARLIVTNINTPVLNNMDFRATSTTNTLPLSTVGGRVIVFADDGSEIGLGRVVLSDGTRSTQTDGNGNYTLSNMPNGSYRITPILEGYVFTPETLTASILGGNSTRNQNFVARLKRDAANRPPFIQTRLNDIPVIAAATTPVPLASVFADPNNDTLLLTTTVEDPTLLRTRIRNNTLLIDALSEGNTMVSITANDNRGGTTTASFRVTVSRPFATPTQFIRPKGNFNTNINAAIVIETQTTLAAFAGLPPANTDKNPSLTAFSGELGAFNENCDCVGSIVWTGNNAVLPVWGEDKENDIPGMKPSAPIHIRYIDNIERSSRRMRAIYILNVQPGLWPIDQAIITSLPALEDDPCKPTQNYTVATRIEANYFDARIIPNPVANRGLITYTLPNAGQVDVEVWNMLGQRVATLASGYQPSGVQRLDFDIESLPTGMYVCRIQSSNGALSNRNVSTIRLSVIR